jgi:uncharacterized protein (TIGR03437 family)
LRRWEIESPLAGVGDFFVRRSGAAARLNTFGGSLIKPGLSMVFLLGCSLQAQVIVNAVTDGAAFGPRVAPGSLATIFGSNLAGSTARAESFPLPVKLAGATVVINNTAVPLVYASPQQINFQVPSTLAAGAASLYVAVGTSQSAAISFTVVDNAPAVFQNKGHAAALNNDAGATANTPDTPAESGSVVTVYLTGQGAVSNPVADGAAAPVTPLSKAKASSSATIGGAAAKIEFLGLAPTFAGLAQANIQVPDLPDGNYPLILTVGGRTSVSALVSVSGKGTPTPQVLSLVGRLNFANTYASSLQVYGNATFVCSRNQINVIDTSDVSAPAYVSGFGSQYLNGNGGPCTLNTAVAPAMLVDIVGPPVANSAGTAGPTFLIYSVPASPLVSQPQYISQVSTQCGVACSYLTGLSFVGATAFTSTSWYSYDANYNVTGQRGDFLAYDFSNPYTPLFVSALGSGAGSNNASLKTASLVIPSASSAVPTVAYATSTTAAGTTTSGSAALDVINIATPAAMQGVAQVVVGESSLFFSFAYDNTLLLVAGNTNGLTSPGPNFAPSGNLTLTTMDITNVSNPVPIQTLVTNFPTMGTYQAAALGGSIFAIVSDPPYTDPLGPSVLQIVDARDRQNPVVYPFTSQFGLYGMAAVTNSANTEFLLVSDLLGLSIYQVTLPSS